MIKKILLISLCFLFLVGCQNEDNDDKLTDEEINLKYEEMKNKLIEYGKLVYENEQWLNDEAEPISTFMMLKDLSERNGYDISMFVNPETGNQCDLEKTKIEFKINEVIDTENIDYEFNPVLSCEN